MKNFKHPLMQNNIMQSDLNKVSSFLKEKIYLLNLKM